LLILFFLFLQVDRESALFFCLLTTWIATDLGGLPWLWIQRERGET